MDMIRVLNESFRSKRETQEASRRVLKSLFPFWLPASFAVMFSRPFPAFSARLNAWVTLIASQWLMGPSELNDVEVKISGRGHERTANVHSKDQSSRVSAQRYRATTLPRSSASPARISQIDDGSIGIGQGLLVERCRFLESAGCASICMNTCKVPTEDFFMKDMGLALEMTPNYEDFSCQFSFNKTPLPRDVDDSFRVACFEQCPSNGALRSDMKIARCHQIDVDSPNEV
ncbi:unnamed protein product [Ascophyllum nodosum]